MLQFSFVLLNWQLNHGLHILPFNSKNQQGIVEEKKKKSIVLKVKEKAGSKSCILKLTNILNKLLIPELSMGKVVDNQTYC